MFNFFSPFPQFFYLMSGYLVLACLFGFFFCLLGFVLSFFLWNVVCLFVFSCGIVCLLLVCFFPRVKMKQLFQKKVMRVICPYP